MAKGDTARLRELAENIRYWQGILRQELRWAGMTRAKLRTFYEAWHELYTKMNGVEPERTMDEILDVEKDSKAGDVANPALL